MVVWKKEKRYYDKEGVFLGMETWWFFFLIPIFLIQVTVKKGYKFVEHKD